MLGDFFSFYFTSLGEFWSSAIRIGLPQILLVVLLICWIRRKGCGKSRSKSCCWIWSCGTGGDSCRWCCGDDCGCTCGCCCCQTGQAGNSCGAEDAGEADADTE